MVFGKVCHCTFLASSCQYWRGYEHARAKVEGYDDEEEEKKGVSKRDIFIIILNKELLI